MPDPSDFYVGPVQVRTEAAGQPLVVDVHLAQARGRIVCVGLDVRAFTSGDGPNGTRPLGDEWRPITSPVMRALPTATVIEQALSQVRDEFGFVFGHLDRDKYPELFSQVDGYFTPPAGRRGPKPAINDETLHDVVAPAYRMGGRRPVQAVKEALEAAGVHKGRVSIDQARKAVAAARAKGFIPPYEGRGKGQTQGSGQ